MAYGREMLRKAGQGLLGLDERYANAVLAGMKPSIEGHPTMKQAMQQAGAEMAGMPLNSPKSIFNREDPKYHPYQDAGVKAAAAGFRYGLPAAGVTLAGKGIIDLTGMFIQENEQTGGTLMP